MNDRMPVARIPIIKIGGNLIVPIQVDMTDETELEELNETLKCTNEEKIRLLGVAAHDLRGGIGGISGLAELLEDELESPGEEAKELMRAMRDEGRRLLDLLGSLLDVSRVEQGRLDLNPARLPLGTVVGHAVRFHQRFAENKNQRVRVVYPKTPVVVMADSLRIRQVLDNLISNAVKYAPHGTTREDARPPSRCIGVSYGHGGRASSRAESGYPVKRVSDTRH